MSDDAFALFRQMPPERQLAVLRRAANIHDRAMVFGLVRAFVAGCVVGGLVVWLVTS